MKEIEIDRDYLLQIYNEFKKGVDKESASIEKEIAELLAKDICDDLQRAYDRIINSWYASYSPVIYKRQNTLKNAMTLSLSGSEIIIEMSSDALSGHRLDNDPLYILTMRQGYHGGAANEETGGVKMYRGPVPGYYMWTRPAEKSFSPVRAMMGYVNSYQHRPLTSKIKKIEEIFRSHYSKYEYFRLFF